MTDDLRAIESALSGMPEDDDRHPLSLLGRWTLMIASDYGHELPPTLTIAYCADYLSRMLPRIAQDPEQDFPLLSTDLRNCRRHMEVVVATAAYQERGVPCPDCEGKRPRLVKHYGHWCDDEACEQIHCADDSEDVWVCPRDRDHWWTETDYRLRVADWYDETTNEASA